MLLPLACLALFGLARDRWHIDLDLRTRPRARALAFVVVVTLAAAITGGIVTGSAFTPRYASVVFVPLLVLWPWAPSPSPTRGCGPCWWRWPRWPGWRSGPRT